jgi:hypothetical protein
MRFFSDNAVCPYCCVEQNDIHNGHDPGPWWTMEDSTFYLECDSCEKQFILQTSWHPRFESYEKEETNG